MAKNQCQQKTNPDQLNAELRLPTLDALFMVAPLLHPEQRL
jgi:hypothetical protein